MQVESVNHGRGLRWAVKNDDGSRYSVATSPTFRDGKLIQSGIVDLFETQAKATEVMREAQDWKRFQAVRDWLLTIGCHTGCSVQLAFAAVEAERGRATKGTSVVEFCGGVPCGKCVSCEPTQNKASSLCVDKETCYDRMKRSWKESPKGRLDLIPSAPIENVAA